jgi:hypothetical protein
MWRLVPLVSNTSPLGVRCQPGVLECMQHVAAFDTNRRWGVWGCHVLLRRAALFPLGKETIAGAEEVSCDE